MAKSLVQNCKRETLKHFRENVLEIAWLFLQPQTHINIIVMWYIVPDAKYLPVINLSDEATRESVCIHTCVLLDLTAQSHSTIVQYCHSHSQR